MSQVILADYGPDFFSFIFGVLLCFAMVVGGLVMLCTTKIKSERPVAVLLILSGILAVFIVPALIGLLFKLWKLL